METDVLFLLLRLEILRWSQEQYQYALMDLSFEKEDMYEGIVVEGNLCR